MPTVSSIWKTRRRKACRNVGIRRRYAGIVKPSRDGMPRQTNRHLHFGVIILVKYDSAGDNDFRDKRE